MDLQSASFVTGLTVTGQLGLEQWSKVLTEGGGTNLKLSFNIKLLWLRWISQST